MEPSISVVVPVWDGEALLGPLVEMLECAAEGLAPGEWECVLVDDGSADGTWAEASRLAEARPWLRPHRAPHAGLGAARNLGASLAEGKLVWFVDADDAVAPGALARVAGRMREDALDVLLIGGEPEYATPALEDALPQYREMLERRWAPGGGVSSGRDALVGMVSAGSWCPCAWLMVLRRAYLMESGARNAEGVLNEDNLLALRAVSRAGRVGVDPAPLYRYRVREGSLQGSTRHGEARLLAHLELLRLFEEERLSALASGDLELASAVATLSSWFVEVCAREGGSVDPLSWPALSDPRFSALAPSARVAQALAAERSRAEAAEAEATRLSSELAARPEPGGRAALRELGRALARRLGARG